MKKERTIEDAFYYIGILLACVMTAAAAVYTLQPGVRRFLKIPPCFFHYITGYYCPGCGGTRAVQALVRGQILRSFYYHPLVPYGAAVYLYFMATQTLERVSRRRFPIGMRYHNCYVWLAAAIVLGNFIMKNILHYRCGFIL